MYWSSRAYYKSVYDKPTINLGVYYEDGGTTGEFDLTWYELGDRLVARLQMFNDAWALLADMAPVFAALSELDGKEPTEQEVFDLLLSVGVKDITEYVNPRGDQEPVQERTVTITIPMSKAKLMDLV